MIKKYTRDTRKILKAWNWKASKVQARDSQGARESSRAYARDVLDATLSPKAQARNDCDAGKTPKAQTADTRYSYFDCLCDKAPAPAEVNGSTLYQLLMVGCMVLFVFTANGVGGHGVSFLAQSHWLYPLMLCIAMLVSTYVGKPVINFLTPRLIEKRLSGPASGIAKTVLSTCITSPITSAITSALFSDPDDFASVYVSSLAITMPMAMFVSFFIVGPLVKLAFHNRISPAGGLRALQLMEQFAPSISRFLGM